MSGILEQIDQAIAGWESRPESWSPGDPLYPMPVCTEACTALLAGCTHGVERCEHDYGHQEVRPMVELLDPLGDLDVGMVRVPPALCRPCAVAWRGTGPCWVCGLLPWQSDSAAKLLGYDATTRGNLAKVLNTRGWT